MDKNILLIEPDYKNKYPPLGLMKIAYFHKHICHDYVRFVKGRLPSALQNTKWDRVYVTTLFTFEWANTIAAINYAKTLVDSINQITVGGIAATMLPEDIYRDTGIRPVTGLLNEAGKLGLPGDECIDQIVPDYSILEDIDYVYPFHDAYFLSATKGCGNKCGFCAVQTLEPKFVPYIDIKDKIAAIDEQFGPKRDLLLMDNNVLRSSKFNQIIDDIISAGFGKGATYINPISGKRIRRFVDFNQGLDAMFLTEEKAKRLGEIALKPARIAFDHIEDRDIYERALRLCVKYGITELSNYVLYNSEDFGGKGHRYAADTPEDLYSRMRITLDLRDEFNKKRSRDDRVAAFSFPMRYIPLHAHERGYIGSRWNAKFLRAVQCMLIPTQGKGVGNRSFFEADFGKSPDEFIRFLCMPENLISARGHFAAEGRGRSKETPEAREIRRKAWEKNQRKIKEWNRLYDLLGAERQSFIDLISDNKFLPEKFLSISSGVQKKLYLHYMTIPRILSLLGMIHHGSPTFDMIELYIKTECRDFYDDILAYIGHQKSQQAFIYKNFIAFFGRSGLVDLLCLLKEDDFCQDALFKKWEEIQKDGPGSPVDFELIRIYRRFVANNVLSEESHLLAVNAILALNMSELAFILRENLQRFELSLREETKAEPGHTILESASEQIIGAIFAKLMLY